MYSPASAQPRFRGQCQLSWEPDGEPVKEATIYVIGIDRDDQSGVDQITLEDWKKKAEIGINTVDRELMINGRKCYYLIIDSPGCALDIWDDNAVGHQSWDDGDRHLIPAEIRLHKEFHSWGFVVGSDGKAMPDAEVFYDKIDMKNFHSAIVRLRRNADHYPWAKTKTKKDGSYSLRGVTFEGRHLKEYEVVARATIDGIPMMSHGICMPADGLASLMEARKIAANPTLGETKLIPSEEISGIVTDAVSGKPIAGAAIEFYGISYDHNDLFKMKSLMTDENGQFKITHFTKFDYISIKYDGYQSGNLIQPTDWPAGTPVQLKIPLPPLVDTEIEVIDSHTNGAPLFPLSLNYSLTELVGEGWTYQFKASNSGIELNEKDFKPGTKNVYLGKLPIGQLEVVYSLPRGIHCGNLYALHHAIIQNNGKNDERLVLRLDRRPGMLMKASVPRKPASKKGANDWEAVISSLQAIGDKTPTKLLPTQQFLFVPAPNWGDKLNLKVTLVRHDSATSLMEREIIADPDAWPVEIDAVALRNEFEEKAK